MRVGDFHARLERLVREAVRAGVTVEDLLIAGPGGTYDVIDVRPDGRDVVLEVQRRDGGAPQKRPRRVR